MLVLVKLVPEAVAAGIIDAAEAELMRAAAAARQDAIQVDSFTLAEYDRAAAWQEATEPPVEAPAETVRV